MGQGYVLPCLFFSFYVIGIVTLMLTTRYVYSIG